MNDPGLKEPINETSANLEDDRRQESEAEFEDEQAFLNPRSLKSQPPQGRSILIQLTVAGGSPLLPFLCSPLLAANGMSLGFALISNFSLLLNMARRLPFAIAQPITIIGWYISSFLLIGDISGIIHVVKVPGQRRALTQPFYYAIFAASLYFIIATLMVITVYGAWKGHYSKEFKLTMSQRTLMLQTISFMVYMVGGAGVYAKIEGWMFLDALYFTNFTLLTVGIGNYAPQTHLGRGLLFPYAVGGIVVLGLVIGSIRSLVLERGKNKLGSRMTEKKREALVKKLLEQGKAHKITPVQSKEQAGQVGMSERERREEEFNMMRKVQQQTATRQRWNALFISGGAWFFLWFMGALIFYFAEHEQGWTYFQALYFSYTTLLTIGFGDFKPFSNSGKAFFVFWSLLAVPTLTIVISNMGNTVVKGIRDATLYLGEFTVLPGESGVKARVKQTASRLKGDKRSTGAHEQEPPGILRGRGGDGDEEKGGQDCDLAPSADKMAGQIEDQELEAAESDREKGDILGSTIHEYHYILAREFRNVLKHLNESPPRQYTYDEWAYYLRLMGEDEGSSTSHRKPVVKPISKRDGKEGPDMEQAQTEDTKEGKKPWSWLGERSPLMGEMEEAEWVLVRLAARLEKELRVMSEDKRRSSGGQAEKVIGEGRNSEGTFEGRKGSGEGSSGSEGVR
ncbi:MAG: hypothetical protein Q9164_000031 [Protoblastenia rupestris]